METHPFWLDTATTTHISPKHLDFVILYPVPPHTVQGVGGSCIHGLGHGTVKLCLAKGIYLILEDVLYVPNATVRLLSVQALAQSFKVVAHFDDAACWLTKKSIGAVIAQGTLSPSRNLYLLNLSSSTRVKHALAATSTSVPMQTWHNRFGHPNFFALNDMVKDKMVEGMPIDNSVPPHTCQSCILGKQKKTPVPKMRQEGHRATRAGEIIWADLSGAHAVTSRTGNRYIMNLVNDYTSWGWSIPLAKKNDAYTELVAWELAREKEIPGLKIGKYCTDNGELKSAEMEAWLKSRGTAHEFTIPYTSAHIWRVE